jgi:DNA-binding CsgD family transcriptional regulator
MPVTLEENALVDCIYEAALLAELWPETLRRAAAMIHCKDAVLATLLDDEPRFVASTEYYERSLLEMLERFPISVNERTQRLLAAHAEGFLVDQDVFTPEELAREPVYQEVLIPQGYGAGVATAIAAPSGDTIIVHLERPVAMGPVDGATIAMLNRLRPHFARAGLLSRRLSLERARAATQALELMGLPAAVLGLGGRILSVNALLTGLIPDVFRDRPSRLSIVDQAADGLLETALAITAHDAHDAAVRSIPIPADGYRPPIIVHLTPIRGRARDIFTGAVAILVATPVVTRRVPGAKVIQGLFDLTPAEAKLAALIAAGHPPRDAAALLGITEGTARTTLKYVLGKTGTRRQADLVGLLQGAAPPGRDPCPSP